MAEKEWTVSHAHARAPITVTGKNLKEALEKEELDPAIWKPVSPAGQQESTQEGEAAGEVEPG